LRHIRRLDRLALAITYRVEEDDYAMYFKER